MTEGPAVCGHRVTVLTSDRPEVVCDLPPLHHEADGLLRHQGPLPTGQRFSWPVRIEA